jgi:UDP-galactopyranose mutase
LNTKFRNGLLLHEKPIRIIFTGRIDEYFDGMVEEPLQYRSLRFEFETHDIENYQPACIVNYPEESIPFTRISEPKKATGQNHPKTTIIKEYPSDHGEPYYPVFTPRTTRILARYKELAAEAELSGVHFIGRLAQYKYLNMDEAIENALSLSERIN